ncbi:PriCT-2 domain-containing protein [Bradyrhizobium sp. CW4]|uniref:PriCT-2 domain-containing protein n=1 Tax=Bradyrhizobium sp. CW4 TaxID=2782687 RepID=UPI001FFA23AB|nr:PriCT-2 domain-containing protein [Bradyrhizobium sp. CW4]MCK1417641.1 PriCT-2 domain-containing protein [Bradyrhizobium sp. CW4]
MHSYNIPGGIRNHPHICRPEVDLDTAERFLKLLDPTANNFAFRTFDDNVDHDSLTLLRTFYGPLPRYAAKLKGLNEQGAGVFVIINQTDGDGRKAENVTKVRAIFGDLDGAPLEPVMAARLKPHLVIESSPGKWHCYWLVAGMALEDFTAAQMAIIARFNSDPVIHDLPRVMRLPGFVHAKVKNGIRSEPFVSRIVSVYDGPAYPGTDFEKAAVEIHTPGSQDQVTPLDMWKAAAALEVIPNHDGLEWHWREWNRIGMATWRATGGSEYGFEAFDRWSAKSTKYNARRTSKVWRGYGRSQPHSLGLGTLVFLADQEDPEWRDRFRAEVLATMSGGGS